LLLVPRVKPNLNSHSFWPKKSPPQVQRYGSGCSRPPLALHFPALTRFIY
jgi:hypothetical protein